MKAKKSILIDVMLEGRFICQLSYFGHPFPLMHNGKVYAAYDLNNIRQYVEEKRPSLKNKNFQIEISNQLLR